MPLPSPYGVRGLYRDADDRYRIDLRFRDPRTGRRERYKERLPEGSTLGAAKSRALEVLNAALTGSLLKRGANAAPETLGPAFARYLGICQTNAARSDPEYKERHRDQWIKTLGAGFRLDAFSELAIERHKRRRREAGKAPGTVNRELVTIKHFLGRCVAWGWLPQAPPVKLLQEPPPRVRWLTDEERARLSAELAKPQRQAFRRLVAAALLSGQRLGKLITLQRQDVDLVARVLTIRDQAKGGRLKTTHIPITPALETVLDEALAASDGPSVFVTHRTRDGKRQPYTRSGVSTFFARVAAEAGIEDFHFHDLRHDFATRVRQGGAGLDVVQALLGHSSPTMTQRYAHLGREELASAASSASGLDLGAAPPVPKRARRKKIA